MAFIQPPENTHSSLVTAMNTMDGVEFDLRLTADEQLIVHHDDTVSIPKEDLDGRPKYLEEWDLDDLSSSDEDESDNHSSDGVTKLDELNMGVFQGDEEKNIYVKGGDAGGGEEEEKEDSPLELFELKHNGTTYYTNNSDSGFLYECIDGKVGKKVGNLEDGKPFFS